MEAGGVEAPSCALHVFLGELLMVLVFLRSADVVLALPKTLSATDSVSWASRSFCARL